LDLWSGFKFLASYNCQKFMVCSNVSRTWCMNGQRWSYEVWQLKFCYSLCSVVLDTCSYLNFFGRVTVVQLHQPNIVGINFLYLQESHLEGVLGSNAPVNGVLSWEFLGMAWSQDDLFRMNEIMGTIYCGICGLIRCSCWTYFWNFVKICWDTTRHDILLAFQRVGETNNSLVWLIRKKKRPAEIKYWGFWGLKSNIWPFGVFSLWCGFVGRGGRNRLI
jgi:hypothetical protein